VHTAATGRLQRWDIFCTVIDNLGDIGVTWRLARQLAAEFGLEVRLWVDDLAALQRLWPEAADADCQRLAGVEVRHWRTPFAAGVSVADVVIEAFACELPPEYRADMLRRQAAGAPPLWINLEYLSAEAWIEECHGLASPQPDGLNKYFYFPGFSSRSGGLLRERCLIGARDHFLKEGSARLLAELGVDAPAARLLSLFCYPDAPLAALLDKLTATGAPWHCLVPEGPLLKPLAELLGYPELAGGRPARCGPLTLQPIPFLRQDRYDQLLWSCDLNLVRGEDSLVRAIWAGKPFIWHIYRQQDGAHWPKLDALLDRYLRTAPTALHVPLRALWHKWNGADADSSGEELLTGPLFDIWRHTADSWAGALAQQQDLASGLVQFCANRV
jgi:uncharacterized repeat protein (TIGR03837 family)